MRCKYLTREELLKKLNEEQIKAEKYKKLLKDIRNSIDNELRRDYFKMPKDLG